MFVFEDTRGKSFFGVVFKYGDNLLPNDRAAVKSLINEVNSTSGPLHAVVQHLSVRVESGNAGKRLR